MKIKSLLDVCEINDKTVDEFEGIKNYVATGDVDYDRIISFEEVNFEDKPSRANRDVERGDILVAKMKETVKIIKITEENHSKYIFSTGFSTLKANEDKLNNSYLYYVLISDYFQNQKDEYSKGATQKAINNSGFKKIKIPVPSIDIQKQIVEALDESQKLIDNRKEQIRLLDDLIESIFNEMFGDPVRNDKGWKTKRMSKACIIKSFNINDKYKPNDLVWLINLDEIESNTGRILNRKKVKFSKLPSSIISFNDEYVLYSKLRPYLNKLILPDREGYGTSELVPILPKKHVNKIYLFNLLKSKSVLRFLESNVSGAKMPRVVMKDFRNMEIPIPPIQLQNKFSGKVKEIEAQKQLLEESIGLLKNNYNSIMQRAFKGELFN